MHQALYLAQIVGNTLAIYVFLILLLRFVGRRELTQLTNVDLLLFVLLGSAVETSMVEASTVFRVGLVSAATLFAANRAISTAFHRYPLIRKLIGGQPVIVVHDGRIIENNLKRLGLCHEQIMEALDEHEIHRIEDARFVVVEPDGEVNVVAYARAIHHTPGKPA